MVYDSGIGDGETSDIIYRVDWDRFYSLSKDLVNEAKRNDFERETDEMGGKS